MDSSADSAATVAEMLAAGPAPPYGNPRRIYSVPAGGVTDLQRRLDDIGRLVSDWIWETDDAFRLTIVTERIFQAVGRLPVEVCGLALAELFEADDPGAALLSNHFAERRNFRDVAVLGRDADGQRRDFLISGVTVFDGSTGRFLGYRGTARDVTGERAAEAALRRHNQIMHAVAVAAQRLLASSAWELELPEILGLIARAAAADGAALLAFGEGERGAESSSGSMIARWGNPPKASLLAATETHRRGLSETEIDASNRRIVMPVFAGKALWGSLVVHRAPDQPGWTGSDVEALTATAGLIGNAIHGSDCQRRHDESSALAATAFATSPDPILIVRLRDGAVLAVNAAFESATGRSCDHVVGKPLGRAGVVAEPGVRRTLVREILRAGSLADRELRFRTADGRERIGAVSAHVLVQAGERCVLVVVRDITERHHADETIQTLSEAVEQSPALVMITDAAGTIEYVNPQFTAITGLAPGDLIGRTPAALNGEGPGFSAFSAAILHNEAWRGEVRLRRSGDAAITVEHQVSTLRKADGSVSHMLVVGEDVSERRAIEARLHRSSRHDALTDLPNRSRFFELLPQILGTMERDGASGALIILDIDHFKRINDSLGPHAGDAVLRVIGQRLADWAGPATLVARIAGDEFAAFLTQESGRRTFDVVPEILALIARPMTIGGTEVTIHASFGIACFPQDGGDAVALLKNADVALSGAKECGGNTWRFFQPEMHARAETQVRLGQDLRQALARDQFEIHFQPVISLADARVAGAEALIRWHHPRYGQIAPGDFVRIAEDQGLIESIGEWVLGAACAEARRWEELGLGALSVAVNISGRQLQRGRVLGSVFQALSAAGLPPTRLVIEITESAVLADVSEAKTTLDRLRTMGVTLSLDDFGTGYASLAYLRQLPFETVKIDQSFIRNLHIHEGDQAIVDAILALAHRLRLGVVAEGIDDVAQLRWLRDRQCEMVQGYLFSPPLPAAEFIAWMRDRQPQAPLPGDRRQRAVAEVKPEARRATRL